MFVRGVGLFCLLALPLTSAFLYATRSIRPNLAHIRPTSTLSGSRLSLSGGRGFNVAVLGAGGGIGQPLSLLLKLNPLVAHLSLFDISRVSSGIAADLSHCCTPASVSGYHGTKDYSKALHGSDVVIIPAGLPRRPGMSREDLFGANAQIIKDLAEACATHCPSAIFLIISNPINSMVPVFAETMKKFGAYHKSKVLGVTTLDVVRAKTFLAHHANLDVSTVNVQVVGGHSGDTIVPLLSQVGGVELNPAEIDLLTKRVQFGGDEVVKAKEGAGSATLSMAFAGSKFADRLFKAMSGTEGVVECAFVESSVTAAPYFSSPIRLGPNGVEEVLPLGPLSEYETSLVSAAIPVLQDQIQTGINFCKV